MPDSYSSSQAWGLEHHFESFEQQREASYLGVWIFLVTEIMFFGGVFTAYIVYRLAHPEAFAMGSHELDIGLGATNTAVLIGSSLTMAMAVWAAQTERHKATAGFILATIGLGAVFLGIKVIEYSAKFEHHLFPGADFKWNGADAPHVEMFFNIYFALTGLHALHMVVGMGILFFVAFLAWRGRFSKKNHNLVEGIGLYWHFVDIIWIFLFPLLYLLGRNIQV